MSDVKVFIIGSMRSGDAIAAMFSNQGGYVCTDNPDRADVIVWPGGVDINPELYGQKKLQGTSVYEAIDKRDLNYWEGFKDRKKTYVGICRGGQFLNVMSGGSLWQHVNNHTETHKIVDLISGEEFSVTSTHHQMMRKNPEKGEVLAIAKEASLWLDDSQRINCMKGEDRPKGAPKYDTEVIWYKDTRCLCFQPHPEFSLQKAQQTKDYFFDLLSIVL